VCPGFESLIRHHFSRAANGTVLAYNALFRAPASTMIRSALRVLVLLLAAAFVPAADAQLRPMPQDSAFGVMRHIEGMIVQIDKRVVRLAPGAQIRDPADRIVLPVSVPPGSAVRYTLDREGYLYRVWILSPQELAREKRTR
jgi:hypothetical protein